MIVLAPVDEVQIEIIFELWYFQNLVRLLLDRSFFFFFTLWVLKCHVAAHPAVLLFLVETQDLLATSNVAFTTEHPLLQEVAVILRLVGFVAFG